MRHSLCLLGYPVAKFRLYWSVVVAIFFFFLLYSASAKLGWLTPTRAFYLILGFVEGILIGQLEAKIVTNELVNKTETIAWQMLPINVVLSGLPLLLAIHFFGVLEILPFAAYFVFPFLPTFLATSGWLYNKFEKQNKVQIFMFFYGFKYWIEPVFDINDEFAHFIEAVKSKDHFAILGQAGYSKRLMAMLEERQEIESSTKNFLSQVLETIKRYQRHSLTIASVFIVSCFILIIYFFVLASTNSFGLVEVESGRIVSGQAIALILGCIPTFALFVGVAASRLLLKKKYQRRISTLLASTNLQTSANLKNLTEP